MTGQDQGAVDAGECHVATSCLCSEGTADDQVWRVRGVKGDPGVLGRALGRLGRLQDGLAWWGP